MGKIRDRKVKGYYLSSRRPNKKLARKRRITRLFLLKAGGVIGTEKMQSEEFNKTFFCRLCLDIIKYTNSEVIEKTTREVLDMFLPNLILEEGHKHMICKLCHSKLFAAFYFKSTCMGTEDIISSYMNSSKGSLVDLKELYLEVMGNIELTDTWEDQKICRLCIQVGTYEFVSLNEVADIIDAFIPLVNISATKDPVICQPCFISLYTHSSFIKEANEKYKNVEQPYIRTEIKLEDDCDAQIYKDIDKPLYIKSEEIQMILEKGDQDDDTFAHNLDEEAVENKIKNISEDVGKIKYENVLDSICTQDGVVKDCLEGKEKYKSADKESNVKTEDIEIKVEDDYDGQDYENNDTQSYVKSEVIEIKSERADQDNEYDSPDLYEEAIENGDSLIHKDPSEIQMYQCDLCSFETKFKSNLLSHQATHKDSSEIQLYECNTCTYKTKHKSHLNTHLLTHKDPSEVPIYKCDTCTFKSKYKSALNRHALTHKSPSEMQMYTCCKCDYKSTSKSNLIHHQLKHKDPSEIQMYKCDECDHGYKRKGDLKKHKLTHKGPSQVQTYKCYICNFETRFKHNLKLHHVKHKDSSQVQIYKCDTCTFESKYKRCLKTHELTHKNPSEVQMYKCDICTYESKHKNYLKYHQLVHKDPAEIQMYMCDECDYVSKCKSYLKRHQLIHKSSSENEMYKCDACDYKTERKNNLRSHKLLHKSPLDVKMYNCDTCSFVTRYKKRLESHQLSIHANSSSMGT